MSVNKKDQILTFIKCCLCIVCSTGLMTNCFGIFFTPLTETFNYKMVQLTSAVSLRDLVNAFVCLFVAKLFDKLLINKILTFGAFCIIGGVLLIAQSTNIVLFYIGTAICGVGCSFLSFVSISMVIKNWFPDNTGTALGFVYSSSGVSGAIFNPILSAVISGYGYRYGYYLIAALTTLIVLPCTLSIRYGPVCKNTETKETESKEETNGYEGADYSTHAVMMLVLIMISRMTTLGLTPIVSSIAVSKGHTLEFGALLMSCSMVGNVAGKMFFGFLCDKKDPMFAIVLACMCVVTGLSLILLFGSSALLPIAGSFLLGASYFVGSNGLSSLVSYVFRKESYARTLSTVNFINMALTCTWTVVIGYLYDISGSYNLQLASGVAGCLFSILAVTYASSKRKERISSFQKMEMN